MNQFTNSIILKPEFNGIHDPHYISLVESEFDVEPIYQEIPPKKLTGNTIKPYFLEKKMKLNNQSARMSPLTQIYVASLTVVGLFIVFRLSLPK
jgi:hypothetical protein